MQKITVGCANFGQTYGLLSKKINNNEIKKIFRFCSRNKIKSFDVADSYKGAYSVLAQNKFKTSIDTKVSPDSKWIETIYCENHIKKILKILKKKKINTLYIHHENFLLNKNSKKIISNLHLLKKKKYFKKLGLSIYDFKNLYFYIKKFKFDAIQCPFNVLDQRLYREGHINKLKKLKIKIHVRSIFLQGILLNKKLTIDKKFKKYSRFFKDYFNFLKFKNLNPVDYCLNFIFEFKKLDKIIIGINSKNNLNEILNYKKHKLLNYDLFNSSNDKFIIDPRKWC